MRRVKIGMPRGRLPTGFTNLFQMFKGLIDPDHELCQALHGRRFGKLDEETVQLLRRWPSKLRGRGIEARVTRVRTSPAHFRQGRFDVARLVQSELDNRGGA